MSGFYAEASDVEAEVEVACNQAPATLDTLLVTVPPLSHACSTQLALMRVLSLCSKSLRDWATTTADTACVEVHSSQRSGANGMPSPQRLAAFHKQLGTLRKLRVVLYGDVKAVALEFLLQYLSCMAGSQTLHSVKQCEVYAVGCWQNALDAVVFEQLLAALPALTDLTLSAIAAAAPQPQCAASVVGHGGSSSSSRSMPGSRSSNTQFSRPSKCPAPWMGESILWDALDFSEVFWDYYKLPVRTDALSALAAAPHLHSLRLETQGPQDDVCSSAGLVVAKSLVHTPVLCALEMPHVMICAELLGALAESAPGLQKLLLCAPAHQSASNLEQLSWAGSKRLMQLSELTLACPTSTSTTSGSRKARPYRLELRLSALQQLLAIMPALCMLHAPDSRGGVLALSTDHSYRPSSGDLHAPSQSQRSSLMCHLQALIAAAPERFELLVQGDLGAAAGLVEHVKLPCHHAAVQLDPSKIAMDSAQERNAGRITGPAAVQPAMQQLRRIATALAGSVHVLRIRIWLSNPSSIPHPLGLARALLVLCGQIRHLDSLVLEWPRSSSRAIRRCATYPNGVVALVSAVAALNCCLVLRVKGLDSRMAHVEAECMEKLRGRGVSMQVEWEWR